MRHLARLFLILLTATLAHQAAAQGVPGGIDPTRSGTGVKADRAPKKGAEEPPPPAVPGARARADSVTPADRAAADLPPTEALFDAINRGDITSARDALTRGADLDGTNLLGLTPTELSVDLGRNDITFLLLSVRGGGGGVRNASVDVDRPAPPPPAEKKTRATRPQPVAAPTERKTGAPVLFAGNGGTAVPSAGFLGFDHH